MTDSSYEKYRIMIVDDVPINLRILESILTKRGYQVFAHTTGEKALKAAAERRPDLILMDIDMPGLNGYEVCQRLKQDAKLKDIPVLFVSGLSDAEDKVKAFEVGGVDYVTKPFQAKEVLVRVKTQIDLCRMRRELEVRNRFLEELVQKKVNEIQDSQLATLLAISKLAEFRDRETGQHIERTRIFCRMLARRLLKNPRYAERITNSFVENIFYAAPLHDIGKIGIPDRILLKPGKLAPDEFEIMKTHTAIGAMTLKSVQERYPYNAFINMGVTITGCHHEKWDGSGYPEGLAAEEIPLSARIMALADVYDALRSRRPYKAPLSREKCNEIILEKAGTYFDPDVVDAFLSLENEFDAVYKRLKDDGLEDPTDQVRHGADHFFDKVEECR